MNKNVPKLRFKEFNDEWKKEKLGKITKLTDGVHFTPEYVENGVAFWSVETVVSNKKPKFITEEAHKLAIKRCHPQKSDILMTRIGTLAMSRVIDDNEERSIYVSLALIKSNENFNSKYLKQYFDSEIYYREFLAKSLLTATPKKINMEDLKDTRVKLPSLQEQEKIADFFTILDSLIEEQDGKVSDLELYKKGMMQKIFSQEIRFKDENGCDYPEWEEFILGGVSDVRDGTHESPKYVDKGYPLITSKNLIEDGSIDYSNVNYITLDDYISINKRSEVKSGDILFGMIGTIGNPVLVDREGFAIKNVALIKEQEKLKNSYLLSYLNSGLIEKQFYKVNAGGTQKFIALNLIRSLVIKTPSLEEQEKIAKFSVAIDNIIMNEKKNLDDLRAMKKGLLQQMFV